MDPRRILCVGAALGAVVLMGSVGCSDPAETLDTGATQRTVGRAVAEQVEPNVSKTTCPTHIVRGKGETFLCTIKLGAGAGTLQVRVGQRNEDGALSVVLLAAVLSGDQVGGQVKEALHDQFNRSFQVDCGGFEFKVRKPGAVVTCTARDRSSRRKVHATITDTAGTLSIAIDPAAKDATTGS